MADQRRDAKDEGPSDPMGAYEDGNLGRAEPIDSATADDDIATKDAAEEDEKKREFTKIKSAKEARPAIGEPLESYATTATETSVAISGESVIVKKPWYRKANPLRWGQIPPIPDERGTSKEATAGFLSRATFQWMAPVMVAGYKRPLDANDIWKVNPRRSAHPLADKLQASFDRRRTRGNKQPLIGAMHETFFKEFWLGGFYQFWGNLLLVFSPFTLRFLIQFATDAYVAQSKGVSAPPIGKGMGLVVGITLMQVCQSFCMNHFIYNGVMVGGQTRAVLISLVFEKAMKISGRAKAGGAAIVEAGKEEVVEEKKKSKKNIFGKTKKDKTEAQHVGVQGDGTGWGNGRVVNIMSVDTYRIDIASAMFHIVWTAPIGLIATLILLIINIKVSALAGFALVILGVPLLTRAVKSLLVRRKAINKITDQRVSLTQEILQAVRFVKYFGWEMAFLDRLGAIRKKEIHSIQILLAIRNGINAVSMSLPIFASMLAFITFSLTENSLNAANIFSSLALFNALRMPLNMLPMVISQVVDAWGSLQRIQEYLYTEEVEDEGVWDLEAKNAIELNDANFTWERTVTQDPEDVKAAAMKVQTKEEEKADAKAAKAAAKEESEKPALTSSGETTPDNISESSKEPFKLHDLNATFGRNELVAIIGSVGGGKSSLLAALAGDMRKTTGEIVFGAERAFCPQYAWIQNATVRENILFGKPMDRKWYNTVIDACALRPDLEMLPNGDATEIGERGITVSGGQKQRINIARAIYFNADIVLMDDPLSAVDAHVGRHIFDDAICGLLKDKCRILATHQLWVLSRCDRIIWVEDGRIQAVGTHDELMANNKEFQELMASTAVEEKKEEPEDADEFEAEKKVVKKRKKAPGLMQAEERAVKSVSWGVYGAYIKASGTMWNIVLIFGFLVLAQGANITTSLWLSWWTSNKWGYSTPVYIGVYAALGVVQALLIFCFSMSVTLVGTTSSRVMLNTAITRTLRAPMSFFDTTPLGRITNRFSRDVDTMDNTLTDNIRMYLLTVAMITSIFILIIAYFPYFAIALVPLLTAFLCGADYYRSSAREVKRFESVFRSNVFAKFSEGLSGTASIRAYGLQTTFINQIRDAIDEMNSAYYMTFSNQRWFSIRVDVIGVLVVFITGTLVVTSRFNVNPSIAGLVLSYVLVLVQMLQFTVRQLAEMENGMNSTERLHYYGNSLEEEAPLKTDVQVAPSWPEKGEIVFQDVEMRYRPSLPLVLDGLNLHVQGGERIGIVGRTGAGKSSIMSTLFRLVELSSGSITIDGLDISKIGLHDLRGRLAIIPQDPTLFRGTIRSNLDPFHEHTDLELWSALRQSDLVDSEEESTTGRITLDGIVEEEGLNFSLGQRYVSFCSSMIAHYANPVQTTSRPRSRTCPQCAYHYLRRSDFQCRHGDR